MVYIHSRMNAVILFRQKLAASRLRNLTMTIWSDEGRYYTVYIAKIHMVIIIMDIENGYHWLHMLMRPSRRLSRSVSTAVALNKFTFPPLRLSRHKPSRCRVGHRQQMPESRYTTFSSLPPAKLRVMCIRVYCSPLHRTSCISIYCSYNWSIHVHINSVAARAVKSRRVIARQNSTTQEINSRAGV